MQIAIRDNSVSTTKGVAILLMVLAHARFSEYGESYINMFHMPLFFMMSGYCFKESYLNSFRGYLSRRIKGVYWPYVKWALLFLIFHNVFYSLNIYNGEYGYLGKVNEIYTLKEYIRHAFFIIGTMTKEDMLLGGYWFLHSYFFAAIIAFFIIWLFKKNIKLLLIGAGGALLLSVIMARFSLQVPHFISSREVLASAFFITGFCYRNNNWQIHNRTLAVVVLGAVFVYFGEKYWHCSMLTLTWQKIIPYYFSALAGSLMIFGLCKWLCEHNINNYIAYIGDRTLDVLTWHFLSFKVISILIIFIHELPIARLAEFPVIEEFAYKGWWIAYLFVGIGIPLLIEYAFSFIREEYGKRRTLL